MKMTLLYPLESFSDTVDNDWKVEYNIAREIFNVQLIDIENVSNNISPNDSDDTLFMYRGWIIDTEQYQKLNSQFLNRLVTPTSIYVDNTYISGWLDKVKQYTPKTKLFRHEANDSFNQLLEKLIVSDIDYPVFVKDFVKSNTNSSSIAESTPELIEIVKELDKFYGIRGGIAVRKLMKWDLNSERRYFSFHGNILSNEYPDIVKDIVKLFNNSFVSIDVVKDEHGDFHLVEIGDGGSSSIKDSSSIVNVLSLLNELLNEQITSRK